MSNTSPAGHPPKGMKRKPDAVMGVRRWTAIVLAVSFAAMAISGLGLFAWHDVPQTQAASGAFLNIGYEVWSHVHIVSSVIFSGAVAYHARLNWRPLFRHFKPEPGN